MTRTSIYVDGVSEHRLRTLPREVNFSEMVRVMLVGLQLGEESFQQWVNAHPSRVAAYKYMRPKLSRVFAENCGDSSKVRV